MNILINCKLEIYRFGLKSLLETTFANIHITEARNFKGMESAILGKKFHLLLIDIEMYENEELEQLMEHIAPGTKIIIFSEQSAMDERVKNLLKIEATTLLSKAASCEQVLQAFRFYLIDYQRSN